MKIIRNKLHCKIKRYANYDIMPLRNFKLCNNLIFSSIEGSKLKNMNIGGLGIERVRALTRQIYHSHNNGIICGHCGESFMKCTLHEISSGFEKKFYLCFSCSNIYRQKLNHEINLAHKKVNREFIKFSINGSII